MARKAEARLAALLRLEPIGGGKGIGDRVVRQWSHLWVWRGQSGQDPTEHAKSQHTALLQHLQQEGFEGAFQSMLDGRVAASFSEARNRIYTRPWETRKRSDLYNAQAAAKDAQPVHPRALERVQKLRQAVENFEDSKKTLACVAVDPAKLEADNKAVTEKLVRLQELEAGKTGEQHALDGAAEKFDISKKADTQIAEMRGKIKNLQQTLAPKAGQTVHLTAARDAARKAADKAAAAYDAATDRTREVRLRRDLSVACVARFEQSDRLSEISARADQAMAKLPWHSAY